MPLRQQDLPSLTFMMGIKKMKYSRIALTILATVTIAAGKPAKPVTSPIRSGPLKFDCSEGRSMPDIVRLVSIDPNEPVGDCYASANLDGSGKDEILVILTGSLYGGSGGNSFYVFSRDSGRLRMIADGSQLAFLDRIAVATTKTNGFADLHLLRTDRKTVTLRMTYNGKQYRSWD
jgi:hypothetical protein